MTNLRFADDVLLVARSLHQAHQMLLDLAKEAAKAGLEIHLGKTKIMNNGCGRRCNEKEVLIEIEALAKRGVVLVDEYNH